MQGILKTGLVTIAIPAYKSSYLKESIESALNQTYPNLELVVVDDCSPNPIKKVVDSFSDSRIVYHRNQNNLGYESIVLNWNRCLEYAQGDFFVLLCDDDLLAPNFVEEMLKLSDKYPKCNVFHARKQNLHEDGSIEVQPEWPEFESGIEFLHNRLAKRRHHTISEFLYRTSAIKKQPYVVFPSGFYSDNASLIQLSQYGGMANSQEPLVTFRFSSEHITTNASPKNCWDKYQAAVQYWVWIQRFSESKQYQKEIQEEVECTIIGSFNQAPWGMKLRILFNTPSAIISLKAKLANLVCAFMNNSNTKSLQ